MNNEQINIEIRECVTLEELCFCQELQKAVFGLPDIEVSPVRHLVVTKSAGGFVLGAFDKEKLVGFVLSVPGFNSAEKFFYSHMAAVSREYQNYGIGAKLKWAQRDFALKLNVDLIKWTFQPVLARNAHFNLNRLGATIRKYIPNYYGTDYNTAHSGGEKQGLDSDRLVAEWNLRDGKVTALSKGESFEKSKPIARKIEVPNDWNNLVKTDLQSAIAEQQRIKSDFQKAFSEKLVCRAFERDQESPKYVLFDA